MKVNWKRIWDEFDDWFMKEEPKNCPACRRTLPAKSERWGNQRKKIQQLVNKQLREKNG